MHNKTFREFLAEKDDEYTYYVRSTADIHHPESFERVRHTLMPFRIKTIARDAYTPWTKENKTFPDEPNSPTYAIKVVTGLPVDTNRTLETMAMACHIHRAHLSMAPEDDVASVIVGKPELIDKETSQALVGQKRIGEFMQELNKDRKDREAKFVTREVYESFFTTHQGLEKAIKKPVRNGYYMIEMSRQGDKTFMRAEGPFGSRPDGNEFRDSLRVKSASIISENETAATYGVQALIEFAPKPDIGEHMFTVGVADMNTGRHFTSMVRASSPDVAREVALKQVAEAHRIDPSVLTAMSPRVSSASAPLMWTEGKMTEERVLTRHAMDAMRQQGRIKDIQGKPHIRIDLPEPGGSKQYHPVRVANRGERAQHYDPTRGGSSWHEVTAE